MAAEVLTQHGWLPILKLTQAMVFVPNYACPTEDSRRRYPKRIPYNDIKDAR